MCALHGNICVHTIHTLKKKKKTALFVPKCAVWSMRLLPVRPSPVTKCYRVQSVATRIWLMEGGPKMKKIFTTKLCATLTVLCVANSKRDIRAPKKYINPRLPIRVCGKRHSFKIHTAYGWGRGPRPECRRSPPLSSRVHNFCTCKRFLSHDTSACVRRRCWHERTL